MRSNVLLFLHVLAAFALVGGILAAAVGAFAARRAEHLRPAVWRTALLAVVPGAIATIVLGEALQGKEDREGAWLDASYGLTYLGLLVGGIVLAVLARLALRRPRLVAWAAGLGTAMTVIALTVVFLMAGKPA